MGRLHQPGRRVQRRIGIAGAVALALCAAFVGDLHAPAHAASPNEFARVAADGTLLASNGGVFRSRLLTTGTYLIDTTVDVEQCAWVATPVVAGTHANVANTMVNVFEYGVSVFILDQTGARVNAPFSVDVDCPSSGIPFVVVDTTGHIARMSPALADFDHSGPGTFAFSFPTNVSQCAYITGIGQPILGGTVAGIVAASSAGPNDVYVETKNLGGGLTDGIPFHLEVVCPTTPSVHVAVVGAGGIAARGSSLTSSFRSSAGHYTIVTNSDTTHCAILASRGEINTAVPYWPAIAETAAGPATNTVVVSVRKPDVAGGALFNQATHTAIIC